MSPLNIEAGLWAGRIVDSYAASARPEMIESARSILLDHLAAALAPVVRREPIGDWPEVANAALDAWEDEARTHGPRVAGFDDVTGTVRLHQDR